MVEGIRAHTLSDPKFGNDHIVRIPFLGSGISFAFWIRELALSFSFAHCKVGNAIAIIIPGVPVSFDIAVVVFLTWHVAATIVVSRLISTRCRVRIFWCPQICRYAVAADKACAVCCADVGLTRTA